MNKFLFGTAVIIMALSAPTLATAGDAAKGEKVFKKCATCHVVDSLKNKIGPSLNGIVGRKAASAEKFKYSKAMQKAAEEGLVWEEAKLDEYLKKPKKFIKGTSMNFAGIKKDDRRADLIAYLKSVPAAK